jgi:magnesium transporter
MIDVHRYADGSPADTPVTDGDIRGALADPHSFLWLDVVDPTADDLERLRQEFDLHPLVIEDLRHQHQRAKVELFHDHAFIVLRPLMAGDSDASQELELHALVGRRFIATVRSGARYDLSETVRRWERDPAMLADGGGFAAYVLIDEVVDGYLTLVEGMEDSADDLEDTIFATEDGPADARAIQEQIFRLKRECVRVRRFAIPLRQGVDLIQERPELVSPSLAPYYRDVMDHVIRVGELIDNIRDLLTSLLEVRVAQVANRLNEVMKKLTAWAGIILIPTLIAGIYGMNFRSMPELSWHVGYPMALGLMVVSAGALYVAFKRRGWL